jgi:hypothetical protein
MQHVINSSTVQLVVVCGKGRKIDARSCRGFGLPLSVREGEMEPNRQRPGVGSERRWALEMLADEPGGCDEKELFAHHGFDTLASLVRDGFVTSQLEATMKASGQTIEVVRARITDKGWKALINPGTSE